MARPAKLTPEIKAQVCAKLETGLFRKHAAELCGIGERTFVEWYGRGSAEDKGMYREFFEAVNRAEATYVETTIDQVKTGIGKNPKIALTLLSRRFPALYGRRDNVEEISIEHKAQAAQATRDRLMELFAKLAPEPAGAPDAKP